MFFGLRVGLGMWVCACVFFLLSLLASVGVGPIEQGKAGGGDLDALPTIELPDRSGLTTGVVVRVLDGDTVLVRVAGKVRRYQLLGADAPELSVRARKSTPDSIRARRFVEQLLLDEVVYIQHDPGVGRDGTNRVWGYLFRAPDMLLANLELVRQGYARHDPRGGGLYAESFVFYQARAERSGKGIWASEGGGVDWAVPAEESAFLPGESVSEEEEAGQEKGGGQEKPGTDVDEPILRGQEADERTVYITKFGSKYHVKDCPHLTDTQSPVVREEVKGTHKPCKTCKPDESPRDEG